MIVGSLVSGFGFVLHARAATTTGDTSITTTAGHAYERIDSFSADDPQKSSRTTPVVDIDGEMIEMPKRAPRHDG